MIEKLKKLRRGLSPVVTTIFLFAVMIGAISVALGIIYPAVNQLNDQIALETAGSSLNTLDTNIQNLMRNGRDSSIFTSYDVGIGGAFKYNNKIQSSITLVDGVSPVAVYTFNTSRLQISQPMATDFLAKGESQYYGGAGDQNYLFLNSTTRRLLSWSIINQSRSLGSDDAITSLSYRSIMSKTFAADPVKLYYNLTINVYAVNITLSSTSKSTSSGTNVPIQIKFLGTQVQNTNWQQLSNDASVVITTQFPEAGSTIATERPVKAEAPVEAVVKFFVRFSFNYQMLEVTI